MQLRSLSIKAAIVLTLLVPAIKSEANENNVESNLKNKQYIYKNITNDNLTDKNSLALENNKVNSFKDSSNPVKTAVQKKTNNKIITNRATVKYKTVNNIINSGTKKKG